MSTSLPQVRVEESRRWPLSQFSLSVASSMTRTSLIPSLRLAVLRSIIRSCRLPSCTASIVGSTHCRSPKPRRT